MTLYNVATIILFAHPENIIYLCRQRNPRQIQAIDVQQTAENYD
jgi:hypothetical protein